ncbi:triose-phosphate isomerase [Rhodopila sp.]|uniref:triose-phosphate isomerase n=1 Tax=Rhodopila sp. TaxID=2480087 RepID=UPI003D0978C3
MNCAHPLRGSVKPSNAHDILGIPDVGGVLIGGASLTAADFDAVLWSFATSSGPRAPGLPNDREAVGRPGRLPQLSAMSG